MIRPKAVTEAAQRKSSTMIALEAEKPFTFPTKDMSDAEKAAWDVWVEKWNSACAEAGCSALSCIKSHQAII